jgi:hypothetical protein
MPRVKKPSLAFHRGAPKVMRSFEEDSVAAAAPWWTAHGWWRRGSRLQTQLYVNRRPRDLSEKVLEALRSLTERGLREMTWVAPLEQQAFAESRDLAMLNALGLKHLKPALAKFWPTGGPVWDALARLTFKDGGSGVLLAEGKNYPQELYSAGTQAGKSGSERSRESRRRIEAAIESVQAELGVMVDLRCWLDPLDPERPGSSSLYQTANRIAYTVWFRRMGIEAWLCHLLFIDDALHHPTDEGAWRRAIATADQQLGLDDVELPYVGHAFLSALDPEHVLANLRDRPLSAPRRGVSG